MAKRTFVSLAEKCPELVSEWHPTKNGDLKSTDISYGSDREVWWQCEKGHPWQARISNRVHGTNCPICKGKKVLVGYNDLATVMPSLASEWHPDRNGALTPKDVTAGSNKKVWWQCKKGHPWETTISHRSAGERCPYCFGETKTSFPEQAIFFYLRQITEAKSRYMIAQKTEIDVYLSHYRVGVEYDGAYYHAGKGAEQRELRKQEELDKLGIRLIRVRELDGQTSGYTIYSKPGANDLELTKMIKELLALISSITGDSFDIDVDIIRDRNRIYEQYIQSEKENSLVSVNPELAKEWHPKNNGRLTPDHVSAYSNKKVWWQCTMGHEWQAVINSRQKGAGCIYCSGYKAITGVNDLATVNPELASQWHPTKNGNLKPSDFLPKSNTKVWWQCERGHKWQSTICDRTEGGGCPICSGHKVLAGYNDLATLNPELAKEWHPTKNGKLTPQDVTCGAKKRAWWLGNCGHEWDAVISSRAQGHGCPYCSGQKVLAGYNDLATLNPALAQEWHPTKNGDITPSDVMPGSHHKAWWLGKCGHEWEAVIYSRNAGRGCKECNRNRRKQKNSR